MAATLGICILPTAPMTAALAETVLGGGRPVLLDMLPQSRLRTDLSQLGDSARSSALKTLSNFAFPAWDTQFLRADPSGALFYEDPVRKRIDAAAPFDLKRLKGGLARTNVQSTVTSVDPAVVFTLHSRPGASRMVYLNFKGKTVTGTVWNAASGVTTLDMPPYSEDADTSTLTQNELDSIAEAWKRIAEDYAPFDIDVTTEGPPTFGPQVGEILIGPRQSSSGSYIYNCSCGGVAYVNVWGQSNFSYYQPALVFAESVPGAKNIAEAASHELGHNLGLSHDGTASLGYYGGQGTGNISWAPIMGVGYYVNVSQWSKGEYSGANNQQDDLAIISAKLTYRSDDHGNTAATADALSVATDGTVTASTSVSSPLTPLSTTNRGTIEQAGDLDVFQFDSTAGAIDLTIFPDWLDDFRAQNLRSANLKVNAKLYTAGDNQTFGSLLASDEQAADTFARISTTVPAGHYYLVVSGVGSGDPLAAGFTAYGSLGQYFIKGTLPVPAPQHTLTVAKTGAGAGTISSSPAGISCGATCSANFDEGTSVTLTAAADSGSTFSGWSGACSGSNPTCSVSMTAAASVSAEFTVTPVSYALSVTTLGSGLGSVSSSPSGIVCGSTCTANFTSGTLVTLSAVADANSTFAGWSGACSGSVATCTVNMTAAAAVSATFTAIPPSYTLAVATTGSGSGSVSSAPAGISCGSTCAASFTSGTVVTLTAAAGANSTFAGWSGACSGSDATCSVTMNAAASVSAAFNAVPVTYALSVSTTGSGSGLVTSSPDGISCGSACVASFNAGTSVTLTAAAGTNSTFAGWSGACTGAEAICTVAMNAAASVAAAFTAAPSTHVLSVATTGSGSGVVTSSPVGISCGSACAASFTSGTVVTLTATSGANSTFAGWSGACSGTDASCTIAMSAAASVSAAFNAVPVTYALSVATTGSGSGVVTSSPDGISCGTTCLANFSSGTSVTLTATASANSTFAGWSGACSGSAASCTVSMTAAASVFATFNTSPVVTTYPLTVTTAGSGKVTSSPSGISCGNSCTARFDDGTNVTLTASAPIGWTFKTWSGACTNRTPTCTVAMSAAKSVKATFAKAARVVLSVQRAGAGFGTVVSTPSGLNCGRICSAQAYPGTAVKLTATPVGGSVFAYWDGACTGTSPTCNLTVGTSTTSVKAVFMPSTGNKLQVKLSGTGAGTVTSSVDGILCGEACSTFFKPNSLIKLTAKASTGSVFAGWSGDCTGMAKTCTVKLSAARSVVANFRAKGSSSILATLQ